MTVIENEVEMDDVDEKISLAQLTREGDVEKIKIMLSKLESDGTSKVNELDESNVSNNFETFYVITRTTNVVRNAGCARSRYYTL